MAKSPVDQIQVIPPCICPPHLRCNERRHLPDSYMESTPCRTERIRTLSERAEMEQSIPMDYVGRMPEAPLGRIRTLSGRVEREQGIPLDYIGIIPEVSNEEDESDIDTTRGCVYSFTRRIRLCFRRAITSVRKTISADNCFRTPDYNHDFSTEIQKAFRSRMEEVEEVDPFQTLQHITGNKFSIHGFVIDPSTQFHYRWLSLVTAAVLYNLIFIIGRAIFWELSNSIPNFWYTLDYTADSIYILDTFIHAHEGFLDQGLMVRDSKRLRINYFKSPCWKSDIFSCLPTDLVYFIWPPKHCHAGNLPCPVICRANRLFKLPRMLEYFDKTETKTGYPNVFRICKVVFAILILIHWNSCFYFAISYVVGFGADGWVYSLNGTINRTLSRQYIYCFYWSTLTLTTIGETPQPENDWEYLFVVTDFLAGVLIFATIVGNIGSMISNMNVARVEFQNRMDGVKQYMAFRRVSRELEARVIRWFAYTWANKQALDEDRVLAALPDKLKAEIAIHVHLDTLKKVRIFQDCEPGLLEELVLKLRLQVFSPGDYICRKGDVGKEMYIVKRGRLSVVADDEKTVLATLSAGSVFGEVSVLDIAGNRTGNRRTANVRSLGYSDLFCLAKKDLWDTLTDYPEARHSLMERGCQLLRKDHLLDEEIFRNAHFAKESLSDRVDRLDKTIELFQKRLDLLICEKRLAKLDDETLAEDESKEERNMMNDNDSPIRNIDSSSSESGVMDFDTMPESTPSPRHTPSTRASSTPGLPCCSPVSSALPERSYTAMLRNSVMSRRSFHCTSRSVWARRRHKYKSSIWPTNNIFGTAVDEYDLIKDILKLDVGIDIQFPNDVLIKFSIDLRKFLKLHKDTDYKAILPISRNKKTANHTSPQKDYALKHKETATSAGLVREYVRRIIKRIPVLIFGSEVNRNQFHSFVQMLLTCGRQSFTLDAVMSRIRITHYSCLKSLDNFSKSNFVAKLYRWLVTVYVAGALKTVFYVTPSNSSSKWLFYDKRTWQSMHDRSIDQIKTEFVCYASSYKSLSDQPVYIVRVLPKRKNNRLICIRWKRKKNSRSFENYLKKCLSEFSKSLCLALNTTVDCFHSRWVTLYFRWIIMERPVVYFVRADFKDAFLRINQHKLCDIIRNMNVLEVNKIIHAKSRYGFSKFDASQFLQILENRVNNFYIKIDKKIFKQKEGIPQGDPFSSGLCNIYFNEIDSQYFLKFMCDEDGLFIRNCDDYLYISMNRTNVESFLGMLKKGFPEFNLYVNDNKTKTNLGDEALIFVNFWRFEMNVRTFEVHASYEACTGSAFHSSEFKNINSPGKY